MTPRLFLLALLSVSALVAQPPAAPPAKAEPAPNAPHADEPSQSDERKPVPLAPEKFTDFIGRYRREDMFVLVFQSQGHFYLKVDDRPRAELFPLSDHEFFLKESPDKVSFERDSHGEVTHFIRHSTAPQLFRRVN